MPASASLIPELDQVIRYGSPQRRAETLKRITVLFLEGASRFNEDHVGLFDRVLGRLIDAIETEPRRELSHRLAPIGNAPAEVIRRLAHDDEIEVARPVLEQSSRIAEIELCISPGPKARHICSQFRAGPTLPKPSQMCWFSAATKRLRTKWPKTATRNSPTAGFPSW